MSDEAIEAGGFAPPVIAATPPAQVAGSGMGDLAIRLNSEATALIVTKGRTPESSDVRLLREAARALAAQPAPVVGGDLVLALASAKDQFRPSSPHRKAIWKAMELLSARPAVEGGIEEGCTPTDAKVLRKANHALAGENDQYRQALQFYADREHFNIADADAWDTVSGEPPNFWCDDAGTATVEDGHIARAALANIQAAVEGAQGASGGEVSTQRMIEILKDYRCVRQHMDDNGGGLHLVDALTPKWAKTIADGEAEIEMLADHIAGELATPPPATGSASDMREWLVKHMPAGTVIGNPNWWADRLRRFIPKQEATGSGGETSHG